jgi:hypothetical protein
LVIRPMVCRLHHKKPKGLKETIQHLNTKLTATYYL